MAELGIGVRDLSVVKVRRIFFGEWSGRLVGVMGVEEMDPHEARAGLVLGEPRFGIGNDGLGAAFDSAEAVFRVVLGGKIVVEIEAAIKAGRELIAVQDDGADEGPRLVSLLFQEFGPRDVGGRKRNTEIGDAVNAREKPGEDAGVRSIGDRAVGEG